MIVVQLVMKPKILIVSGFLLSFAIGFMVGQLILIKTQKPSSVVNQIVDRSLDKYTIENLSKAQVNPVDITVERELKDYPTFSSDLFSYKFDPSLSGKDAKKVSGLINIPKGDNKYPLIVMVRGYVPTENYFVGNGTINASLFFAKNGYITIAPDFLGYGESDIEATNVFESRFQTYTTLMVLLKSIQDPAFAKATAGKWDHKNVFIWAHSNGGQIALTTLEATGITYPTVLWAPVSSPFPFSVLYYTDEANDTGKFLRRELSKFEEVYDTDLYSLTNYLDKIKAPIRLVQGTSDDAVPVNWSDNLSKTLKAYGLHADYSIYNGADHQMSPIWNTVIQKDLEYFNDSLEVLPH